MKIRFRRLTQIGIALFALLFLRLGYLQVLRGVRYARLSDRNRIRRIVLPAPRGKIFDRNGVLLADTRPSWTVAVIPTETNDSALTLLSTILNQPVEDIKRRLEPIAAFPAPVNICRDVPLKTVAQIEENNFRLPGVLVRVDPVRNYPYRNLYAHSIGYLGEITEEELSRDTSYRRLDYIGKTGIEAKYERYLRGRDGFEFVEVDVRGREIGPLLEKRPEPPIPGKDIHLTIDHRLQSLAYELTAKYERAAVVGILVKTGEVLCLVSRPDFDPNIFLSPLNAARWESLVFNPSKPFFNRAISSGYPPGSTFKPLVALLAQELGLVTPQTTLLPCSGVFRYGNRDFKCWSRHGRLNLLGAIEQSCNTYFYQLGMRIRVDTLASFCERFGLGRTTGIDIPGEGTGNIPSRDFLNRRYGKGKWTQGVMLNFAIGQGEILLTPLQLALAYAGIANNGFYHQPRLVLNIDSAGRTILCPGGERFVIPLQQEAINAVKRALTRVVLYGTGRAAQIQEITIAGKTGTAQNPPRPDHALFVGYAPAEEPEVVFAVVCENAGHGGAVAAPIVSELVRAYFANKTGQ
ncbi:MAG: penicillin-binding protein 2 [candidate division WOR-3 bacterium]